MPNKDLEKNHVVTTLSTWIFKGFVLNELIKFEYKIIFIKGRILKMSNNKFK